MKGWSEYDKVDSSGGKRQRAKVKSGKFMCAMGFVVDSSDRFFLDSSEEKKAFTSVKRKSVINMFIKRFKTILHLSILFIFHFLLFTLLTSCNQTFEPFQENDRFYFTVYGFIDANADTQWVRVSPVRGELEAKDNIPEMQVTLTELESANTIIMTPKLVQFRQGFNAVNVWTDEEIKTERQYRLRAVLPDGNESSSVITMPNEFPTPRIFIQRVPGVPTRYFIWIDGGVDKLADVQSRIYVRIRTQFWEDEQLFVFSHRNDADDLSGGKYTIEFFPNALLSSIEKQSLALQGPDATFEVLRHQFYIASGGPEWDENISLIDDLVYNLPDGYSNIDNGLGYFAGIFSRLIPYKQCFEGNALVACPEEKPYW